MTNDDLYKIEMNQKNYLEAAKLALRFAAGKFSKNGAWRWANTAAQAAKLGGVTLALGTLDWPDIAGARKQLGAAMAKRKESSHE